MSGFVRDDILSRTEKIALYSIVEKGIKLRYKFDVDYGVRYPEVERIFNLASEEALDRIEELFSRGYLTRQLQSNFVKCPTCGTFKILVQLKCPNCNSFQIRKGLVFEHYKCGYQGFKKDFAEGNGYVCPKCGENLEQVGVDFKSSGTYYHCEECDEYFGTPQEVYRCLECDERHSLDELVLKHVWLYEGNSKKIQEIIQDVKIDELAEKLEEYGDVEIFGELKGKSGVNHVFTLIFDGGDRGKNRNVVGIKFSDKSVPIGEVMSFYVKLKDIEDFDGVLLAIPRLSEEAKNLARSLEIRFIEGKESEELVRKLEKSLIGTDPEV